MKISDIRNHLTKLLSSKTGLKVFVEDQGKLIRPSLYVELIDSNRTLLSEGRELFKCTWNIRYIPTKDNSSCNTEISDKLDDINLAFDVYGQKRLKVNDRYLMLRNITQRTVDNIGNFLFDTDIIVQYGTTEHYELMQTLEVDLKKEVL